MSIAGRRLLLVEDNAGDVRLFREMLASLGHPPPPEGFMVAGSLGQAEAILGAGGVDALILDLGLPDGQGLDTLRSLIAGGHDLPIIVLTGLDDRAVGNQAVEIGAQDYLVKDHLTPDLLQRAVRYAIGRHQALVSSRSQSARAAAAEARLRTLEEGRDALQQQIRVRRRAEADLQHSLSRLRALRSIDRAIIENSDLAPMLEVLLEQVLTQLELEGASVLQFDGTDTLSPIRSIGVAATETGGVPAGDPVIATALRDGVAVAELEVGAPSAPGLRPFAREGLMRAQGLGGYRVVALATRGQLLGALELFSREPKEPTTDLLAFIETLAGQTAMAIDSAALQQKLRQANLDLVATYDATIDGWSRALDLRDRETEGHSRRVTELSLRLAAELGVPAEDMAHLRRGALLHDIGKMGVPDAILQKPGPLDDREWEIMRAHTTLARDLLAPIAYLNKALDVPYCHHERWDGTGYPQGLKGEAIPLAARIFALADVYDALTSDRPYRKAWSVERALDYLREQADQQFDPAIVEVFMRVHRATAGDQGPEPSLG